MTSPGAVERHVLPPAGHERLVPRWLPLGFFATAVFLVPWSAYLLFTLPHDAHANHWALAWIGFDVGMMVALFCTAFFSLRRSMLIAFWATMTGTITIVDAWFDVLTSRGHVEQTSAIVLAIVGEIPLTIVLVGTTHPAGTRRCHPTTQKRGLATASRPAGSTRDRSPVRYLGAGELTDEAQREVGSLSSRSASRGVCFTNKPSAPRWS